MAILNLNIISSILILASFSWFITNFEILRNLKWDLGFYSKHKNKIIYFLFNKLTDCEKCMAFWTSLSYFAIILGISLTSIITVIGLAAITSITALLISKLANYCVNNIESFKCYNCKTDNLVHHNCAPNYCMNCGTKIN